MSLTYTLTDQSVTILGKDFVPKTMPKTHPAFDQVVAALKADNDNEVYRLMDLPNAIVDFMRGHVTIAERVLYYQGKPLDTALTRRILQFMEEGNPELAQPLINFLEKVMENPSRRAVMGLYEWCEKSGLPITPEGDILAWKIVNYDYRDFHSGRFDNSVGQIVEVDRNEVDEDPDRTCSYGLHFCSTAYLPHYYSYDDSRHIMVVKLHPRDVVAFPRDYNTSKGRACRYEVVGEVPPAKAKDFFPSVVSYANFSRGYQAEDVDAVLDDELELDRYYRTRDGRIVEIVAYDEIDDSDYPFVGEVLPSRAEKQTFGVCGSWNLYEPHPLDLVELLPADYDPDAKEVLEPDLGARFSTRAGWTAEIDVDYDDDDGFCGTVTTDGGTYRCIWNSRGYAGNACDDLVERLPDEDEPKGSWLSRLFTGKA